METLTVPALRPVPATLTLSQVYAACRDVTAADVDLPLLVREDAGSSIWMLALWASDEIDLVFRIRAKPVWEAGVIDGFVRERHVTKDVTVCVDVKAELLSVALISIDRATVYESLDCEAVHRVAENWSCLLDDLLTGPVRRFLVNHYE